MSERKAYHKLLAILACLLFVAAAGAQESAAEPKPAAAKKTEDAGLPLKPARVVEFTTDEGTWMSLDIAPDGSRIVFDLLGDIYVLPAAGGEARRITSGMAWDCQPRFSPDGREIAFISDRGGNDNVWLMNADGSNPRAVTKEKQYNLGSPAWAPDGNYIVARRYGAYPLQSYLHKVELWLYHRNGGKGAPLVKSDSRVTVAAGASFSPDGKWLYFSGRSGRYQYNQDLGRWQIHRLNRETGEVQAITSEYGGALRPVISPGGNYMAYATRRDAKTGLRLRDLRSRREFWLAYPIGRDEQEGFAAEDLLPGYAFARDGKTLVIAYGGKIHRIELESRENMVVPFTAPVRQELAERVYFPRRIADGPVALRQLRWPAFAPGGQMAAFSAAGKLWTADLSQPGAAPKRLTESAGREYAPAFSPDGKWIAWVSWSDRDGGHLWKAPAAGGAPQRLSAQPGFYASPAWSEDSAHLAFVAGSTAGWLAEDRSDVFELRWMPAEGGEAHHVTFVRSPRIAPVFSASGDRLYYMDSVEPAPPPGSGQLPKVDLVSVRLDGVDKRRHLRMESGTEAIPSPGGETAIVSSRGNLFLTTLPSLGAEPPALDFESPAFPLKPLTLEGGQYPRWADKGDTLTWSFANRLWRVSLQDALAAEPGKLKAVPTEVALEVPRPVPSGRVLLRGARIVTMRGDEVIERGDLLVENNRIVSAGPRGRDVPAGATVVDVTGKTIIPGLVDIHAHMRPPADVFPDRAWPYAANLAYGVTTTRDPSISSEQVFAYGEMVETGEIVGPRIFSTGTAMTTLAAKIDSLEDARRIARRYAAQGADSLKQYMQPRRAQRQWIAMAAREAGVNLTAEGGGELKQDLSMVLDGYTGFEHSLPIVPLYKDVTELLARSGTVYTPTLIVSYSGFFGQYFWRQNTNLHADEKLRRFTPHEEIDRKSRRRQLLLDEEYIFQDISRGAAEVLKKGGKIALGAHGEQQGIGAHWELWMLEMGGLTPHQALRVATAGGAEALGLQDDVGSLQPGRLADLIVLNKNPLENIRNSTSIAFVMKNGELFEGETLDRLWPAKRPLGKFFWQEQDESLPH